MRARRQRNTEQRFTGGSIFALLLISIAAGLAACAGNGQSWGKYRLIGTQWQADEIGGQGTLPVDRPTLLFASDDGEVNGNASCNLFFGKARIEGTNLSFSPLGTTRRACGSEVDEQEFRYLQALDNSRSYTLSGGSLSLHGDNGGRLVRFSQMFSR